MDERPDFVELIAKNRRTTWLLMLAFFVLLALVAVVVSLAIGGGLVGVVIGTVIAAGLAYTSYVSADRIAIASTRAVAADPQQFAQLHNVVEEMAIAAGIPKPRVYIVDDPAPNAFATGKDYEHAAVAATTGLLAKMNRTELQGVIAHELAHVRNYDIRVMTVAVATAGSIALITDIFWRMLFFSGTSGRRGRDRDGGGNLFTVIAFVVVLVLAPLAAALLKAAISRRREALADATAIAFTRYPTGLRQALEKLDADSTVVRHTSHATSHLWIETPDDHDPEARGSRINDMFDTHPPLRERIDLLRAMEGLPPYTGPDPALVAELHTRSAAAGTHAVPSRPAPPTGVGSSAADSLHLDRAPEAAGANAPPGWYADPSGIPGALRYWDGSAWSDSVYRG